ncbi:phage tail protein [Clostridium faecium]|uniref:Phage tail protein n=1 Tax=Clostridium faecium TaxID=2762223 RepID=A0ABR8YR81_9CLOT|nr:phage tail protein [Clostridium faecium]MBD8046743.1 phage tail protein [Clostridium faecium]
MAEQFYSILTSIGKAKIANASVLGTKLNLITLAVGDGNGKYYNPTETQESLVNEVWRGNVGVIATDSENSNWIVIETMIAGNVGGFFIREVGVFDDEGNLIAIGKYPETYKPIVSDGATKDLTIRIILEVSNASNVTLKIDPTIIMATKKDIETLDNKIKNIKIPVTKVNNKLGDVTLKAEDIKANNDKTIEENLLEVTSQMADITKQVEGIEVTAEKTTLDSSKFVSKNVKAGMEELFTFADNGKKNISTVIGSPLTTSDTFDNMKSKIQTLKNTFASNLTAKEQSSSGSESLENLINKVKNINPQKKWAEGNFKENQYDESSSYTVDRSIYLKWKPGFIIVYSGMTNNYNYTAASIKAMIPDSVLKDQTKKDDKGYVYAFSSSGANSMVAISIVSDTEFKVKDWIQKSHTYYWLAIEL